MPTSTELKAQIIADLADNTEGEISAADIRAKFTAGINYTDQEVAVVAGDLSGLDTRVADLENNSSPGGLLSASVAYNTAIPFAAYTTNMATHTLTTNAVFTVNATGQIPGATTIVPLRGDGTHEPDFSNFKVNSGSPAFNKNADILNVLIFTYVAGGYWVTIMQEENAQPDNSDVTAPTLVSAVISNSTPAVLPLTFNEALASTTPAAGDFAVMVAGASRSVSSLSINSTAVSLTLSSAVTAGQAVTVSYTPGTNKLQDTAGNFVAAFTAQTVTNNVGGVNAAPSAIVNALIGSNVVGSTLLADYVYSDSDGDLEGDSIISIQKADNEQMTVNLVNIPGNSYQTQNADIGKYFWTRVGPVAATGTALGAVAYGAVTGPIIAAPTGPTFENIVWTGLTDATQDTTDPLVWKGGSSNSNAHDSFMFSPTKHLATNAPGYFMTKVQVAKINPTQSTMEWSNGSTVGGLHYYGDQLYGVTDEFPCVVLASATGPFLRGKPASQGGNGTITANGNYVDTGATITDGMYVGMWRDSNMDVHAVTSTDLITFVDHGIIGHYTAALYPQMNGLINDGYGVYKPIHSNAV